MKRRRKQVDYVLLSFFDGIGAAPAILEHTHGKPLAAFAWEIDEACVKLTKDRLPWLRHRGDLKKADLIVVTAAPPCQDFSRIGQSPGHAGQRGALFLATAEFYWKTRSLLPDRRWAFPRTSPWNRRTPTRCPRRLASTRSWCAPRTSGGYRGPGCGGSTRPSCRPRWTRRPKHGSYRRLRLEEPRQPESELVVDDLRFHPAVAAGRLKLPCATTPAEDDAGRPAPKRARQKLSEATKARWAADSRRFAPWRYAEEAMITDKAGKLHVVPASAFITSRRGTLTPPTWPGTECWRTAGIGVWPNAC